MTDALIGIVVALVAANIALGWWLHSANDDRAAIRDILDGQRAAYEAVKADRDSQAASLQVTQAQLKSTRDRLSVAESQRNDAYREARDHYVERIKASGIADAAGLVTDLLSSPLPGGGAAASGGDGGKAAAVQPAAVAGPAQAGGGVS